MGRKYVRRRTISFPADLDKKIEKNRGHAKRSTYVSALIERAYEEGIDKGLEEWYVRRHGSDP